MEKYYCSVSVTALYLDNSTASEMISQMLYGETCEILETEGLFSKVRMDFDAVEGWCHTAVLKQQKADQTKTLFRNPFGEVELPEGSILLSIGSEILTEAKAPAPSIHIREAIVHTALQFLNVPFLSGGRSFFGVDGSGFLQLVYKINGIQIPRSAHAQALLGEARNFVEESEPGDLAFFEDREGNITHVGLVLSPFEILHAHGKVRKDALDFSGIYNAEQNKHTHKLRFVKSLI